MTGESIPVIKAPISETCSNIYVSQADEAKKHTLFSGSKLLQVKPNTLAVVTKVGYQTTKGELIRDILYPKEFQFSFIRDSYYFVAIMGFIIVFGFLITLPKLEKFGFG